MVRVVKVPVIVLLLPKMIPAPAAMLIPSTMLLQPARPALSRDNFIK
jgi:hypothetical protein